MAAATPGTPPLLPSPADRGGPAPAASLLPRTFPPTTPPSSPSLPPPLCGAPCAAASGHRRARALRDRESRGGPHPQRPTHPPRPSLSSHPRPLALVRWPDGFAGLAPLRRRQAGYRIPGRFVVVLFLCVCCCCTCRCSLAASSLLFFALVVLVVCAERLYRHPLCRRFALCWCLPWLGASYHAAPLWRPVVVCAGPTTCRRLGTQLIRRRAWAPKEHNRQPILSPPLPRSQQGASGCAVPCRPRRRDRAYHQAPTMGATIFGRGTG